MRLSYYGGGHYDSVSPIIVAREAARPSTLAVAGVGRAGQSLVAGVVEPAPEPGWLEEEALERSRRRAALAGDGRCEIMVE